MDRSSECGEVDSWALGLARFLQQSGEVEALRFDATHKKVEIATLGVVDLELLEARLVATIEAINDNSEQADFNQACPAGISIKTAVGGGLELQKPTCFTGPTLWRWRELDISTQETEASGEEWRFLAGMAVGCAVFGILGFVAAHFDGMPLWLPAASYCVAMIFGGYDAFVDAKEGLFRGELDIHFLMLAVAIGAASIGAWAEGALLLFLFSFSGALEHFALFRTKREINSLFDTAPKSAIRILDDGSEEEVSVNFVAPGDLLFVRPGGLFPVDSEILDGKTAADESNLTGEANPISKFKGDPVFGGTLNLWGAVKVKALRPAGQSSLQKVIHLIREAQHLKAPSQRFTDKFGTRYTLGILGLTGVMFLIWWLWFGIAPFTNSDEGFSAFYRAMTLLVVASPCALVLSIPSAILAAIAWGARHGILFRGGAAIEKLADVDLVALDKTGTLTTGEMEVASIESFPPGKEREAAELACALEANGSHPIGRAIRKYGKSKELSIPKIHDFQAMSGRGVQGREGETLCVLGRRELLEEGPLAEWVRTVPEPNPEYIENWIFRGDLIARILLKDQIRVESQPILDRLRKIGVRSVMLTGDRRGAAESVGHEIGIDEVRAGLSPEDKVSAIRQYSTEGYKVAMVGDGVNDAPSLAAAYVSVAMGARGSDAALEQSEVILMNDRIDNFLEAISLSNRARTIIRQNLAIALGTVVLMAIASIFGLIPLSIGVAAHEGSTVIVCINSLRLLFMSEQLVKT